MTRILYRIKTERRTFLVLLVASLFHLSSLLHAYGWADDWAFISGYRLNSEETSSEHLSGLRPLLQVLMDISFGNIQNYENLVFLRLISLIGMLLLTFTLIEFLVNEGFSRNFALSFGLFLNLLPTFWIYTNWATVFVYSWVCLFTVFAFRVYKQSKFAGILLNTLCFLVYQPAAVFSVFLLFAVFLRHKSISRRDYFYSVSIISSAAFAYLIANLVVYFSNSSIKGRTNLVDSGTDLVEKILWLVSRPIFLSIRPFVIESTGFLAVVISMIGVLLSAVALLNLFSGSSWWKSSLNFSLIYALGLLPILVIAENQIEFRTLPATSSIGLLLVLRGGQLVFSKIKFLKIEVVTLALFAALSLYASSKVSSIFLNSFESNRKEILLATQQANETTRYWIYSDQLTWPQNNYIGALSVKSDLQMPWVPIGQISQILKIDESRISMIEKPFVSSPPGRIVINLSLIREKLKPVN
jgi:hypothetical protein